MATLSDLTTVREVIDLEGARAFLRDCVEALGGGFHPDTPAQDYVDADGDPTFQSEAERAAFDANLTSAILVAEDAATDVYALTEEAMG